MTPSRLQTLLRDHPLAADALLALLLVPVVLWAPTPNSDHEGAPELPATAVVVAVLTCAALAFRRVRPRAVLALTILGSARSSRSSTGGPSSR